MPPDRPNARLLALLVRHELGPVLNYLETLGPGADLDVGIPLDVTVASELFRLDVRVHRLPVQRPLPGLGVEDAPPTGTKPTPLQARILRQASDRPQTKDQLLSAAGEKANSYNRKAITELVRSGRLVKLGNGRYLLPPTERQSG